MKNGTLSGSAQFGGHWRVHGHGYQGSAGTPGPYTVFAVLDGHGSGWITVFTKFGSSNVVRSAGLALAKGSRRALSGFDHFTERLAMSPIMRASWSAVTSPGSGIVSSPVPHTDE